MSTIDSTAAPASDAANGGFGNAANVEANHGSIRFTTLWGGGALTLASLLTLLFVVLSLMRVDYFVMNQVGPALNVASAVTSVVGLGILAFGVRGERGVAGDALPGKLLVAALGIVWLADMFIPHLVISLDSTNPRTGEANNGVFAFTSVGAYFWNLAVLAVFIAAGVVLARAHILRGIARWSLLGAGVVAAAGMLLATFFGRAEFMPAVDSTYFIGIALQLAFAIAVLMTGRAGVVGGRFRTTASAR